VDNIEIYGRYWKEMRSPDREAILKKALNHFGKPWNGPTIAEMAGTSELENLPVVFSLNFLMPFIINQVLS